LPSCGMLAEKKKNNESEERSGKGETGATGHLISTRSKGEENRTMGVLGWGGARFSPKREIGAYVGTKGGKGRCGQFECRKQKGSASARVSRMNPKKKKPKEKKR